MTHSKALAVLLLGSSALLGAATPSQAQTAAPAPAAPAQAAAPAAASKPASTGTDNTAAREQAMQTRRGDRKAFMDARIAALQAGLQLTPQQQPLWSPVETALRDLTAARQAFHMRGDRQSDPAARLKQRGATLIAMGQAMGKLADAAGPLLNALSPDQKGRLPILLRGVGPHRVVQQAFATSGGEGMEDGGHDMRRGRFADRDGGDDSREFREGEGGYRHHGWGEREGRAGRDDGPEEGRFERQGGPHHHFRHDEENDDDRG